MGDDLNKRISEAQAKLDAERRPSRMEAAKGVGLGFRMASDFIAAVIVGAGLGWGLDELFGWSPWGLIVCLLLGFITGVKNVIAAASGAAQRQAESAETGLRNQTPKTRQDEGDGA